MEQFVKDAVDQAIHSSNKNVVFTLKSKLTRDQIHDAFTQHVLTHVKTHIMVTCIVSQITWNMCKEDIEDSIYDEDDARSDMLPMFLCGSCCCIPCCRFVNTVVQKMLGKRPDYKIVLYFMRK